jgi:integrase
MGSIYTRPGTKYLWIKYLQHGRVIRESTGTVKPQVAARMLRTREGDVEHGIPIMPKLDRVTFDDAAADVINDFKANGKRSLRVADRRIRLHLTPYFGGRRLAGITAPDVRAFVAKRQADAIVVRQARRVTQDDGTIVEVPEVTKPVSAGEINRELQLLKRIFNLAMQSDKLARKPHIALLHEDNVRTGFLEPDQIAAVCGALPAELRPVIRLAAITGWRIPSEVLPLEWRQVDFDAGEIRLDPGTTKNREGRVFPLTADLRTLLSEQHAEHERLTRAGQLEPWVFFRMVANGRRGPKRPQPIKSLLKAFKAACRQAGCPGRIPHDLRRTAVRSLVRAGIPEGVAMKLTGHKTRSVFERYNIVSGGDLKAAAARLDEVGHSFGHSETGSAGSPTGASGMARKFGGAVRI